ncbi:U3 snoRNP protein, partial [Friedmanniomyces endolithicus]
EADTSPHLELNLLWLESLLRLHGRVLKERQGDFAEVVRMVQRAVARLQGEVMKVAERNRGTIDYLLGQPRARNGVEGSGVRLRLMGNGVGDVEAGDGDESMDDGEEGDASEWIGLE